MGLTLLEIRLKRARSWIRRARSLKDEAIKRKEPRDLDGEFVFYWIAFNALFGQPRYRDDIHPTPDELADGSGSLSSPCPE